MVLIARRLIEKTSSLPDVKNITVLGLDQGSILLFSASTSNSPNSSRTIIGGIHLRNGEEKIYYRHPSAVRITHASINATRSLCCFVMRTETYEVFVAEIGAPNSGRLFSLNFSRSSPFRAYLAPHDIILLLYRDVVTVFRMPNSGSGMDASVAVDRDAQLSDCIYFQWDTLEQRLHTIQRRPLTSMTTTMVTATTSKTASTNADEAFLYTMFTINARGQFDSIIKVNFDLQMPPPTSNIGNFEILSSDNSLYLCWQLSMDKEVKEIKYAVVSLGHGRTFYISKPLDTANWEKYQSRKIHFGFIPGDYVFADLRGEFTHLLNFNIQLNFVNHLFLPNDPNSLPYETKYTTQRGLLNGTLTLLYEKKNLFTYTIDVNPEQLIQSVSSSTVQPILSYAIVALKDNVILRKILEKILFELYDDLDTKNYLAEALTALIFIQLSRRSYNHKHALTFPATTVSNRHGPVTDVVVRTVPHHRDYHAERAGTNNLDPEYYEKLKASFRHARNYRHKIPYFHPIMIDADETESFDDSLNTNGRQSPRNTQPTATATPKETRSKGFSFFDFGKRRASLAPSEATIPKEVQRHPLLFVKKNEWLYQNLIHELNERHNDWGKVRIEEIALEFVQATQDQCNSLIKTFTNLAKFGVAYGTTDDNSQPASERYKTLLVIMEKLYLAIVELGFSPTEELQRTLLDVSFRVMPFDRFIAAVDQNILTLTYEFVQQVLTELDKENPKSYTIAEQLIFMLKDVSSDSQSALFDLLKTNRAKRMCAQINVARSFSTDRRARTGRKHDGGDAGDEIPVDEIINANTHSRLVEQAAATFYRDCVQRNNLDRDELRIVKAGLITLASPTP